MAFGVDDINNIILAVNGFGKLILSIDQLMQIANTEPSSPEIVELIKQLENKNKEQDVRANELRGDKYKKN